jgi:hypothetical protein
MKTYETDYFAWANHQVALLRSTQPEWLDWKNLAEEVEDLGRSVRFSVESHLENVLVHLLKARYQPARSSRSWETSVLNARLRIERLLRESPSLKARLPEALMEAYRLARGEAGSQMGMDRRQWEATLPPTCPWRLAQVLGDEPL